MKSFAIALCCLAPTLAAAQGTTLPRVEPAEAGFSVEALAELREFLDGSGSSALIVLHDGRIVFEWGDTRRVHLIHSMRKALLARRRSAALALGRLPRRGRRVRSDDRASAGSRRARAG